MHEVLVNRLGGLSLPRKSVVRLTDRPNMTLDVYRGRKTTIQPTNTGWLELPLTGTNFHGPRPVRATKLIEILVCKFYRLEHMSCGK